MNRRKLVGGAGTAILITAAIGYGISADRTAQRSKIPPPKRLSPDDAGPSISLRKPLPTPRFGTSSPLDERTSLPDREVRPKARLAASASEQAILAHAMLDEAASGQSPAPGALAPHGQAGAVVGEPIAHAPLPAAEPRITADGPVPAISDLVLPEPTFGLADVEVAASTPTPTLPEDAVATGALEEPVADEGYAIIASAGQTQVSGDMDAEQASGSEPTPVAVAQGQVEYEAQSASLPEPVFAMETVVQPSTSPDLVGGREIAGGAAAMPPVTANQAVQIAGDVAPAPQEDTTAQGAGISEVSAASHAVEDRLAASATPTISPAPPPGSETAPAAAIDALPRPAFGHSPVGAVHAAAPLAPPPAGGTSPAQTPDPPRQSFAAAQRAASEADKGPIVAAPDLTASRSIPPPPTAAALEMPASYAPLSAGLVKRGVADLPPDEPALTSAPGLPATLAGEGSPISYQDELIMEVRVNEASESDTIIAYGTRDGLYLPLGPIARILDLAISVTDEGRYAHGWILQEDRTLTIDLRSGTIEAGGATIRTQGVLATAFEGELYLRADQYEVLFPLKIQSDLRTQSILVKTLEPFPFEERLARMVRRAKLEAANENGREEGFERVETPYRALSIPTADIELRAVSDNTFGTRAESDVFLAGDLGYLSAEAYFSGDTINGPTASLFKVGRVDPDAQLLGPLSATAFALGDVNSLSMPLGLRSIAGRGATVTNAPSQIGSVFDRVDLRGILPDGYEVELYRNDILIGSTRESVNGQYEFLQIPVDFGLNVFRFVFFGPQGQRSEVVERISVGDGRLAQGKLVYSVDAAQKQRNLFGVRPADFIEQADYGDWRTSAQLSYGVTSGLTALAGAAWFQDRGSERWLATTGLRTGMGGLAIKADAGVADGGAYAFGAGVGGRFGRSSVTASHTEYGGLFPDETVGLGSQFLRRATEIDLNTALVFGGSEGPGLTIPLSARLRNLQAVDGRNTLGVGMRASVRSSGLIFSNTLDYSRTSGGGIADLDQLFGNFDLATLNRSRTRGRLSLGYALLPDTDLLNASVEVDHRLDERTSIRGTAGYFFGPERPAFGLSAIRDLDRFTLALDANYSFVDDGYFVGLRLGYSLGRDPLRGRVFVGRPGLAASGGASVRVFRDRDGDGVYGPLDEPMEGVDFFSSNRTGVSDAEGVAQLSGLGVGRAITLQLDPTTLPDIDLAPRRKGIEIVPRPGTIQAIDYPIVSLSEIEGTARFANGAARGVSGVRLRLVNPEGEVVSYAKTEVDGYFFFEQIRPGRYTLTIDPDQSARLGLCRLDQPEIVIAPESAVISRDLTISQCD